MPGEERWLWVSQVWKAEGVGKRRGSDDDVDVDGEGLVEDEGFAERGFAVGDGFEDAVSTAALTRDLAIRFDTTGEVVERDEGDGEGWAVFTVGDDTEDAAVVVDLTRDLVMRCDILGEICSMMGRERCLASID